jgi:GTPase SAR1 family protein
MSDDDTLAPQVLVADVADHDAAANAVVTEATTSRRASGADVTSGSPVASPVATGTVVPARVTTPPATPVPEAVASPAASTASIARTPSGSRSKGGRGRGAQAPGAALTLADRHFKVLVVGPRFSGKTSMCKRLDAMCNADPKSGQAISMNYTRSMTSEMYTLRVEVPALDAAADDAPAATDFVTIKLWETLGQDNMIGMNPKIIRGSDVCLVTADICSVSESYRETAQEFVHRRDSTQDALVANKVAKGSVSPTTAFSQAVRYRQAVTELDPSTKRFIFVLTKCDLLNSNIFTTASATMPIKGLEKTVYDKLPFTQAELQAFCADAGFEACFLTSAKRGNGLQECMAYLGDELRTARVGELAGGGAGGGAAVPPRAQKLPSRLGNPQKKEKGDTCCVVS